MAEDYDSIHHMRRDVHDAHTNSQVAKLLGTLALIASVIALAVAIVAYNKAGDAQSTANRATERLNSVTSTP
ncbi:MAG: hypothetical protein JWM37_912 [Candidatus Saccharibacteria bacterium]|nr:hypothetical protein [Candidatus Saccharibacteria bacterium]